MQSNYSQQSDYELVNKDQDVRGWPVKDAQGTMLGKVRELVVDTDAERVTTLVLDNGKSVPATDVILQDHVVLFGTRGRAGMGGSATAAMGGTATNTAMGGTATGRAGEQVIPVVEEFLKVGKRTVGTGHVSVSTDVKSVPVEQQVALRKEQVSVERRPVNREISPADAARMQGQTVEVTAQSEEAVVAKVARVVEEIVLRKDVTQTTETVRDTVKHTEVRVDDSALEGYRSHYDQRFARSGYPYEQMMPAYRFGHSMRNDQRFQGRTWNDVEPNARTAWEERNPGTWENFKEAIQHAWQKVTG